jgi:hypothetical protein
MDQVFTTTSASYWPARGSFILLFNTIGVFKKPKKSPSLDIFWTLIAIQFLSTQKDKHGDGSKPYPPGEHQNSW